MGLQAERMKGQASFVTGSRAVELYEQGPFFPATESLGLFSARRKLHPNIYNEKQVLLKTVLTEKVINTARPLQKQVFRIQTASFVCSFQQHSVWY